jgi:precorrin-6A/cobalt-precorrin-6A reductase
MSERSLSIQTWNKPVNTENKHYYRFLHSHMTILAPDSNCSSQRRIWLLGGTSDSRTIAEAIAAAQIPCTITVTTATARDLYPASPHLCIRVGCLNIAQMEEFCPREGIAAIVDASHPHSAAASQGAIASAHSHSLPYLRYERPEIDRMSARENVRELASFAPLLEGDCLQGERVLLAVGCRPLPLFQPWQERATLFARILPSVNSLRVAAAAGFSSDRLIAIRPPLSRELEKALWQQWQISLAVTKASGTAGGEDIKRSVAAELDVPLIVISRPKLIYPQATSDLTEVLRFCCQHLPTIR